MKQIRIYTVREFDRLTRSQIPCGSNTKLSKNTPIQAEDYDLLRDYLIDSSKSESDDSDVIFKFISSGIKQKIGETLQIKNYVGIIQLKNGTQIQILPNIYTNESDKDSIKATLTLFMRMLRELKDITPSSFQVASVGEANISIYEIFIHAFLEKVSFLIKTGLKSEYTLIEENLPCYKGKLKVSQHIKYNAAHMERFYTEHQIYSIDNPENRILKAATKKVLQFSNSSQNQVLGKQILFYFDECKDISTYKEEKAKIKPSYRSYEYEETLRWADIFLSGKSFSIFRGSNTANALLFPMHLVFEKYIAHMLKKMIRYRNNRTDRKWTITPQAKGKFLFDDPYHLFKLTPDLKIDKEGCSKTESVLLDTKWKHLIANKQKNNGISTADMYQMYAYSRRYEIKNIWLLYPSVENDDEITPKEYRAKTQQIDTTIIHIKLLDLFAIANDCSTDHKENPLYSLLDEIEDTLNRS